MAPRSLQDLTECVHLCVLLCSGPAASDKLPVFIDADPSNYWDPDTEPCDQRRFEDYTGVDSLSSFVICLVLFLSIQFIEHKLGKPLFRFGGDEGYIKDTTEHPLKGKRTAAAMEMMNDPALKAMDASGTGSVPTAAVIGEESDDNEPTKLSSDGEVEKPVEIDC